MESKVHDQIVEAAFEILCEEDLRAFVSTRWLVEQACRPRSSTTTSMASTR